MSIEQGTSIDPEVLEAVRGLLTEHEVIRALECVSMIDGRGIPGGHANRRRRSRVLGDLLSLCLPDVPRWVSGRVAGGAADSVAAQMAAALRTDEYADLRVEHYLCVTDRRVQLIGRSLPNAAIAVRPLPWSPLNGWCELARTDVSSATRTRRWLNTARLRLDFTDHSWLMLGPTLGNRVGKIERLAAALNHLPAA